MNRSPSQPYIVVGLDESDQPTPALDWAVEEARRRRWSIRVVVAQTPLFTSGAGKIPVDPSPDRFARQVAEGAVQRMDAARARLAALAPDVHVDTTTGVGTAARLLVAESFGAELLVVGRGRHGVVQEAFAGSTSAQVVAHSSCPVVVVDALPDLERAGGIVVGVDGSPAAQAALDYAFDAAQVRDVGVIAVHAWWLDAVGSTAYVYDADSLVHLEASARLALSDALSGCRERYPDVVVREELVAGRPVDAITTTASHADLIVVGSRGHGGFAGLLLGSVSQGLLHHARPVPLVVVRPHRGGHRPQRGLAQLSHQA